MADRIDPRLEQAIVHTESSGRPSVIGDQGESIGLMQISKTTARGLYKQGLLPKMWEGKNVKKKDLPKLLEKPEFNKIAGSALHFDDRRRLKAVAKKHGIELTPERLDELAIRSHNQGVTKTIKRELLGQEPTLPKVDEYFNKIKARINKQAFQDGGFADYDPLTGQSIDRDELQNIFRPQEDIVTTPVVTPTPAVLPEQVVSVPVEKQEKEDKQGLTKDDRSLSKDVDKLADKGTKPQSKELLKQVKQVPDINVRQEYLDILNEYKDAKKSKNKARKLQAILSAFNALGKFGAQYSAGKVSSAGGFQAKAPRYDVKTPTLEELAPGPKIEDIKARLSTLKGLQGKQAPGISPYQRESLDLQERRANIAEKGLGLSRERLGKVQIPGELRRGEQFVHRAKEKDELSDKQTDKLISLDNGLMIMDRVTELVPGVKQYMGPVKSRIESAYEFSPWERDPKFIQMKQVTGIELADYVRTISGAAVSEQEADRLSKNIPLMKDSPAQFDIKLKEFKRLLVLYKKNHIDGFRKQGKDPTRFEVGHGYEKVQNKKVTSFADKHFGGDYQKAQRFLKSRGDI